MGTRGRRSFLLAAGALCLAPRLARAQARRQPYRIGILATESGEEIERSLRELGYVTGRDVVFEVRVSKGRAERLDALAAELVRAQVDVIVAPNPAAALSAKRATATIPIVMMHTPDPVQLGLVASLARPGGNVTGTTTLSRDLSIKQLELVDALIPHIARIALLMNPGNPWHPVTAQGLLAWGRSLGRHVQVLELRSANDFDGAFGAMKAQNAQAALVLADPLTYVYRQRLAGLGEQHRLPMVGSLREYAEAGFLISYWADGAEILRSTARYVDQILKGAKPESLPVEQPTKFELVVNLRTAGALGLKVPQALLARADRVIE
ncbi:MAG: ABC transporter substrate-binding protein [Burkholderiales bacterium]|nr:ABC transporter substrate-binding protein [Burkholderiales bacterium]